MSSVRRAVRRGAASRRSRRETKSILVVQFDSEKLEADGLDLAPFVHAAAFFYGVTVCRVRATSLDDLHTRLAELVGEKFDVVATVGHSNKNGIRIAPDTFVTWDAYAAYLKPFEPRRLAIIACLAGQFTPTGKIFASLQKVRRIYATPALANKMLGTVMVLALPYLLDHPIPDRNMLRALQVGLAFAGRQL